MFAADSTCEHVSEALRYAILTVVHNPGADVAVVRAQRILDEVDEELKQRAQRPLEEDFITADV